MNKIENVGNYNNFSVPNSTKVFVIEGIAGAGKNTLHEKLKGKLSKNKIVYDFSEEELIGSWKHFWIKDIHKMRLVFMKNFLDYCENIIQNNKKAVFILNRFHISYALFSGETNKKDYRYILNKLKKLKTLVYLPLLGDDEIAGRSSHKERLEPIWQAHLKRRLKTKGVRDITSLYTKEQKEILSMIRSQGIEYQLIRVPNIHKAKK